VQKHTLRFSIFVVPGIGKKSSPCARIQANVNCEAVPVFEEPKIRTSFSSILTKYSDSTRETKKKYIQPFFSAICVILSTIARFFGKFSLENRGYC